MGVVDPSIPWIQFPIEVLIYVYLMGILYFLFFLITCAGLTVVALARRSGLSWLGLKIRRFTLFLFLLLLAGAFFNGLWSCLVWGHLYESTDYVIDFTPFFPVTQGWIQQPFGNDQGGLLGGASYTEVKLAWGLFALGTWSATLFFYRLWRPNDSVAPVNTACEAH